MSLGSPGSLPRLAVAKARGTRSLSSRRPRANHSPEKRKVGSSILSLTTSCGLVSSAPTSANADWALSSLLRSSDHDCPCVTVVGRSLSHADRTPCLRSPDSRAASAPGTFPLRCAPCAPPLPPIGLTAAVLFAGGEVLRTLRVYVNQAPLPVLVGLRAQLPLDAVPEAYHNRAAVWWGAFAASSFVSSWTRW